VRPNSHCAPGADNTGPGVSLSCCARFSLPPTGTRGPPCHSLTGVTHYHRVAPTDGPHLAVPCDPAHLVTSIARGARTPGGSSLSSELRIRRGQIRGWVGISVMGSRVRNCRCGRVLCEALKLLIREPYPRPTAFLFEAESSTPEFLKKRESVVRQAAGVGS
jgi:hypothetical protein